MGSLFTQSIFKTIMAVGILLFTVVNTSAQTGAGGVGNASTLPMWYDANEMNLANGAAISQVNDISGNNNHLTQATVARQPIYNQNMLNGLPVMSFDGVNDFLTRGATAGLTGTDFSYFIVFRRSVGLAQSLLDVGYTSEISKWTTYSLSNNRLISLHRSPTAKFVYHIDGGQPTFVSTHITSTNTRQYRAGLLQQSLNTPYTAGVGHNLIRVGTYNYNLTSSYYLNGYIAEIIVYNSALNNLERIIVENYLGAKYNMAIPTDLFAFEATHNVGLIALGNNGVNTQTTAQGYGILQLSAPSAMTSGEYLLAAHTNVALTSFTSNDLPVSIASSTRFTRTWKADETGDVGNVTLVFNLAGGNNFGMAPDYRLLVDNATQDGNFADAAVLTGVYDAGLQTLTFTTDLNDGDVFTLAGKLKDIHSITTGNWSDPNTWDCSCVPLAVNKVFIEPTHNVTVDINAAADSLVVVATGTLTMNSPVTLSLGGQFDVNGTLAFTNGKVAMVGSQVQSIDLHGSAANLFDLEIANTASANVTLLDGIYTLDGTLGINQGNLIISASPTEFIVNSIAAVGGARIGTIAPGASIAGNVTIRRFMPGGIADYRDIASPVIGATLAQWDDDMIISGMGFPDGCAYGGGGCFYSVKRYDTDDYVDVTSISQPLTSGMGFEVFAGDDLNTWSGTTLDVTGTVHSGSDYMVAVGNEYQLIGNPFASPISFDLLTRVGVDNFFYVYCATTGFTEYYDGSDGSSSIPELAGGNIAMGQAFYTYDAGSITFKETDKVASATFVKSANTETAELKIMLRENASTYYSSIALIEDGLASDDIDDNLDIRHFSMELEKAPTVSLYSSGDLVRKNHIADDKRNKSFELYTKILNEGYHTFEITSIENFNNYLKVLLFDHTTGEFIDLKKELAYTFYSESFEGNRFTLILTNEEVEEASTIQTLTLNEIPDASGNMSITQMGHNFNVVLSTEVTEDSQVKLVNVLGQTEVYSTQVRFVEGSNMITVPSDLKGVHILVITTGDELVTKKVVL